MNTIGSQSLFLQFFGTSPQFRILDFLMENRLSDFTKTEISKGAEISWASLFNHWNELEKNRIVQPTRTVGRAKLYRLNENSQIVKQLKQIEMSLIKNAALTEREQMVAKVENRRNKKN